jgi:hypothetical protein
MKQIWIITLICFLLCGFHTLLNAEPQCPEDQYWNPKLKRCVFPGDGDPDVDRTLKRELMAECQTPCGDGWCCWEQSVCHKCQNEVGNKKIRCYKAKQVLEKTAIDQHSLSFPILLVIAHGQDKFSGIFESRI